MKCSEDNPCTLPFEEYVEQRASASKDAPVQDCGTVGLESSLGEWQAAHDCALAAATAGEGFRVIWQGQSIDSIVTNAFVGLQAESYAVVALHADEGLGSYSVYQEIGTGLTDDDGCTVSVGELCLAVVSVGETQQLCPAQ
jgi:hypothetical protein